VSPAIVKHLSPEDAAHLLQRRLSPGPVRYATKKTAHYTSYRKSIAKKALKNSRRGAKRTPNYRKRVWHELHVLICTDDKRYENLRKMFGKESKMTQAAMVASISAAIGSYIGAAATLIAPFVTLGLIAFLQVSKNAWCSGKS
jgi:hypothetical protein